MFAEVSWKQAVLDRVLVMVNERGRTDFTVEELHRRYGRELGRLFPRNHHVRAKVRQILQFLRDDGLLVALQTGCYALDLGSPHVHTDAPIALPAGRELPPVVRLRTTARLRDTVLGLAVKALYQHRCQACGETVPLTRSDYVESHHLRPLGNPHNGPDTPGNVIVLCPNHHTMFDRGAAGIEPEGLRLVHARPGLTLPRSRLELAPGHELALAHLRYHYTRIFRPAGNAAP